MFRSFKPDFVLIRQNLRDAGEDYKNLLLGLMYGGVPSVNNLTAIYNFQVIIPGFYFYCIIIRVYLFLISHKNFVKNLKVVRLKYKYYYLKRIKMKCKYMLSIWAKIPHIMLLLDFIIYIPFIKPFDNCYVFYEIGQTMGICTPAGFTTSFG